MKKPLSVLVLAVCFSAILPTQVSAAGPVNFYIRGGVITDSDFSFNPFLWTAGAEFDFNLGNVLSLTPECDIIVYKFNFEPIWLAPAVILNVNLSSFYFGGGLGKFIVIGSGYDLASELLAKFNAGFRTNNLKLQAYIWTPLSSEFFKDIAVGATLGFGF